MNKPAENLIPYVGMPVTYKIGSDSYAYEIEKITPSLKTLWLKAAHGHKKPIKFTLRTNGHYFESGSKWGFLILGYAVNDLDRGF
jgi:hypothetical protein